MHAEDVSGHASTVRVGERHVSSVRAHEPRANRACEAYTQPGAVLQVADSAQSLGAGGLKIAMTSEGRCRQLDGSTHSMPGQSPLVST